jgi:uroporphyrin-3 C-methyltransferase
MSNQDEQQQDAEFPDESELAGEQTNDEAPALPAPEKAKRKGSGAIAWIALIIAIMAAMTAGYYLVVQGLQEKRGSDENMTALSNLRDRMTTSDESLSSLDAEIDALAGADARAGAEMEALRADLESRLQLLESLPSRMSNVESSVASFQGVSTGARNRWLLAEAEYYMQIANAQLQLAGNPHLASLALSMADERVAQIADPALIEVRRALSDELAALEGMEKPDIEGITLTLSSLARVVNSLPLREAQSAGTSGDGELDASLSGADRAWESVKGAVSGLVRVTPPDETAVPLMTPDAEYFLRTNLSLQLQVARLALLRGEHIVFEQSLADASIWLSTYFDTESAPVRGAEATIAEIRTGIPAVTVPDISESLRLLRQFHSINESEQ